MENSSAPINTPRQILSVAIIAHVDHGKTTLVDGFLRQTGTFRDNEALVDCAMDTGGLERERGITILAKNTAVEYEGRLINIVDTPGHADFGGEVERILASMVDAVVLVVDAAEGPMPQTRFVLKKALERGLKPMVVINKIDRSDILPNDPYKALEKVLELFLELDATEEQMDFPYVFAAGRKGIAKAKLEDEATDLRPLLDMIVANCPPSDGDPEAPLQIQVSILGYDDFVGRLGTGRIKNGTIRVGQVVSLLKDGEITKKKVTKLFGFKGLKQIEITQASAGEIVAIAGLENVNVSDTIASGDSPQALPRIHVDEPTLKMAFIVNDSPFAGREGRFVTSRQLRARLDRELETNVSLRVADTGNTSVFMVSGRGELHLGILVEEMRREGYELAVSRPEVILKEIDGVNSEPFEKLLIDVPEEFVGDTIQELNKRKGELLEMKIERNRGLLEFSVPTRGLIGFHSEYKTMTKGRATVNSSFLAYRPHCGEIGGHRNGVIIATATGTATEYALEGMQDRGDFFIGHNTEVYAGMIVGEGTRAQDLGINVCKMKKLTNVRTTASEGISNVKKPIKKELEACLGYIADDELIEITPKSIRLRKRDLNWR